MLARTPNLLLLILASSAAAAAVAPRCRLFPSLFFSSGGRAPALPLLYFPSFFLPLLSLGCTLLFIAKHAVGFTLFFSLALLWLSERARRARVRHSRGSDDARLVELHEWTSACSKITHFSAILGLHSRFSLAIACNFKWQSWMI